MRGFMRFVRSSRLLTVGAIAFIITLAAALAAFLCDRLGVGVPWLPSGLHAVSALSGLTAGASPVLHSDMGWQYRHHVDRERHADPVRAMDARPGRPHLRRQRRDRR